MNFITTIFKMKYISRGKDVQKLKVAQQTANSIHLQFTRICEKFSPIPLYSSHQSSSNGRGLKGRKDDNFL